MKQNDLATAAIKEQVLQLYQCPVELFNESGRGYFKFPQTAKALKILEERIREKKVEVTPVHVKLKTEEIMQYIVRIESQKIETQAQIQMKVFQKKIQPKEANQIVAIEKCKLFD